MDAWSDRVEDLLYEGEDVEERVDLGDAAVIVTSHRVLAFTPQLEGKNFREVKRPNVSGAAITTTAESNFLAMGVRAGLYGVLLLGIGLVVDFSAIMGGISLTGGGTQELGIGNVLGMVEGMISLIGQLDYYMRLFGALLLVFAIVPLGVYAWTRERHLVIEVAGDDDIHVAVPEDAEDAVERVRTAILPDGVPAERSSGFLGESWNPFE
ncbi:hypothetical protein [Halorhabdus salina]|uniref:hypothetical protein n=1 Tax=Halorhabdus salina TaxID=2750670 RepID=UPI0015EFD8D0|nr:hypothetical protein [Halorhabdus salina]